MSRSRYANTPSHRREGRGEETETEIKEREIEILRGSRLREIYIYRERYRDIVSAESLIS